MVDKNKIIKQLVTAAKRVMEVYFVAISKCYSDGTMTKTNWQVAHKAGKQLQVAIREAEKLLK